MYVPNKEKMDHLKSQCKDAQCKQQLSEKKNCRNLILKVWRPGNNIRKCVFSGMQVSV